MQNTVQQDLQEFTVSLKNADADFMAALSSTAGDFSLVLQVSPNDVQNDVRRCRIGSRLDISFNNNFFGNCGQIGDEFFFASKKNSTKAK